MKNINDVLLFRNDISPFLVHLTRRYRDTSAEDNLRSILRKHILTYGESISSAKYGMDLSSINNEILKKYFSAVSFTETPLNEIHCLLEIEGRDVNLEPYGLVYLKDNCKKKGVSPVIYLNNTQGDKDNLVKALCSLIKSDPTEASAFLPMVSFFGQKLQPAGSMRSCEGEMDFLWEREWRYASDDSGFEFDDSDVFIGLCPHEEIGKFEQDFPQFRFIDPQRNIKSYAKKLVHARKKSKLKYSVV